MRCLIWPDYMLLPSRISINLDKCIHIETRQGHFFSAFFCLPPGFLPVVGPTEQWCCLRHLAWPCYVALGQALICGCIQNWSPFLRVCTLYLCLVRSYVLQRVKSNTSFTLMTVAIHYKPTWMSEFKFQRKEHCSCLELNQGPLHTRRLTYQCARSPQSDKDII